MTNPTITHNHGFFEDCYDTTGYAITNVGMGAPSLTVDDDDFFKLQATYDGAGTDYIYYEKDITNIDSSVYTHYVCRYKTEAASNGAGAMVKLVGTTDTQTIVGDAVSSPQLPAYSTNFTTASGTVETAIGNLDKVQFYNMATTGGAADTYDVWYDFLLIAQDNFTFPFVSPGALRLIMQNRYASIPIPGRVGNALQYNGAESLAIEMGGEINSDTDWGTAPKLADKIYQIWQESYDEPWQWFTSNLGDFKVVVDRFEIAQDASVKALRTWNLRLLQQSRSGGQIAHHANLDWFGW